MNRCSSDETEEDALWAAVERGQTPRGAATGTASLSEFRGAIIRLKRTIPSVLPWEESRKEEMNRETKQRFFFFFFYVVCLFPARKPAVDASELRRVLRGSTAQTHQNHRTGRSPSVTC